MELQCYYVLHLKVNLCSDLLSYMNMLVHGTVQLLKLRQHMYFHSMPTFLDKFQMQEVATVMQ